MGAPVPTREASTATGRTPAGDSALPYQQWLVAISVALATCACVFAIQWRFGFNWADEGWLWYASQRTAHGEVPIRDFFSYDPGRYYWSAGVFKLIGRDGLFEQLISSYLFGAIGVAVAYMAAVRAGMRAGWRVLLVLMLAIVIGFPRHKIFEQSLSLICAAGIFYVLSAPESRKRWFVYGLATGLAAFIGRNSGLYFVAAAVLAFAFLWWDGSRPRLRVVPALLFGIVIGYSPIVFMALRFHGFPSAFVHSVLLTPQWAWRVPVPFPWHSHIRGLHGLDALQVRAVSWLCLAVPITYAFVVWRALKEKLDPATRLALAASLAGIPYLHHAFYHADFFHIAQGIVPFVLVVPAVCDSCWQGARRRVAVALSAPALVLIVCAWIPYEPRVQFARLQPQSLQQVPISGRQFFVLKDPADVMQAVAAAFKNCGSADGSFLAAPYYPGMYPFLKTRAPFWELYYLYPRDVLFQQKHIAALQRKNVSLVLLNRHASMDGVAARNLEHTYPKLVDYIVAHYARSPIPLPDGFELYFSPQHCNF